MTAHFAALLQQHKPSDDDEAHSLVVMRQILPGLQQPFSREQKDAHFTGSAVVVDPNTYRVALLHHAKLNRWLQLGGHAEPADDGVISLTALHEAREETGCAVCPHDFAHTPIDVDVHLIPVRSDEPAHYHLDVRFLLIAEDPDALSLDTKESLAIKWFTFADALALIDEYPLRRLLTHSGLKRASVMGGLFNLGLFVAGGNSR
ncbi:MAG: NUDIX hydrolase [Gammaproteobacteria bacterium]|nr:NUDIX hydrolase [Gammaproteobacteria bacterium]